MVSPGRVRATYRRNPSGLSRTLPVRAATHANRIIAAYALIWGFEGAARRWVPGTNELGLVLRDAILVAAVTYFFMAGRPRRANKLWATLWALAITFGTLAALNVIRGHTTVPATALGLRSYLIPVLLAAFAVTYADRRLLVQLRKVFAVIAYVNVPIVLLQVSTPPDSVFNREIGGAEAYFVNAGDIARASGTFAAPSGLSIFLPIALAVTLGAIADQARPRLLFAGAALSCGVMGMLSGSRSALLSLAIVLAGFTLILVARMQWRSVVIVATAIMGSLTAWWFVSTFASDVVTSFETRIDQAAQSEDTTNRILNVVLGFLASDFPLIGDGVGSRSASGSLISGQPWVEDEFLRWTYEIGIVGYAMALASLIAGVVCGFYVLASLRRHDATRLMVLWQLGVMLILGAATQQPTTQGAFALMFVLAWVSAQESELPTNEANEQEASGQGRSTSRRRASVARKQSRAG